MIRVNILSSSEHPCDNAMYTSFSMYSVVFSNRSQYFASEDSFKAIDSLDTKSALLCACCDSATFAPMLVPARSNCLLIMYSCLLFCKSLQSLTISTANRKLFASIIFSAISNLRQIHLCPLWIPVNQVRTESSRNCQLSIVNCQLSNDPSGSSKSPCIGSVLLSTAESLRLIWRERTPTSLSSSLFA